MAICNSREYASTFVGRKCIIIFVGRSKKLRMLHQANPHSADHFALLEVRTNAERLLYTPLLMWCSFHFRPLPLGQLTYAGRPGLSSQLQNTNRTTTRSVEFDAVHSRMPHFLRRCPKRMLWPLSLPPHPGFDFIFRQDRILDVETFQPPSDGIENSSLFAGEIELRRRGCFYGKRDSRITHTLPSTFDLTVADG